ncbi:MAG: LapA family protein [Candidatus Malihini olakiniferum]
MKYLLIFLMVLGIFIVSITFWSHNEQIVTINYLLAKGQYHVSTLLATLFVVGFVLGWVICGFFYLRLRILLGRVQRKIKRLEHQQSLIESETFPSSLFSSH